MQTQLTVTDTQWAPLAALAVNSVNSPRSKRLYRDAIRAFVGWYRRTAAAGGCAGFTRATVMQYRAFLCEQKGRKGTLAPATVNVHLTAIRKLAKEGAYTGAVTYETAQSITEIPDVRQLGLKLGNWLPLAETEMLLTAPPLDTPKGIRDRAILAVCIGCGLRRSEVRALDWSMIQQREGRWVIVDMVGKGERVRSVPMPAFTKAQLDLWRALVPEAVPVFLPVLKGGRIIDRRITTDALHDVVQEYGAQIGVPALAPHDLRRTFAWLSKKGKARMEQIQLALGHSSIATTERYLRTDLDLQDAACDRLGISLA